MSIANVISEIDAEIARLKQARTLLSGAASPSARKSGRPANAAKKAKRNISPEGRAKIVAAVKARWAKVAAQKKAAAKPAKKAPAKKVTGKAVKPVESGTPQQ